MLFLGGRIGQKYGRIEKTENCHIELFYNIRIQGHSEKVRECRFRTDFGSTPKQVCLELSLIIFNELTLRNISKDCSQNEILHAVSCKL